MNSPKDQLYRPVKVTAEWAGVAWDVGVMVLVVLNLLLIVFDSLFRVDQFADLVQFLAPVFHDWYKAVVFPNFTFIDLCFVAVFAADVLLGWATAIWKRTYYRWFFYPFLHWYDVLGCIPLSGFRWLRVLRVIALGVRLQRLEIIDVRQWRVYAFLHHYYDILVEEISDRVVVNVLQGMQSEVKSSGNKLQDQVLRDVVAPRRQMLTGAISERVVGLIDKTYSENRHEIRGYVGGLVERTVRGNSTLTQLERIPGLGAAVARNLESVIRDSVYQILDEAVKGLHSTEFDAMINSMTESVFDTLASGEQRESPEVSEMILEILDLVIAQVRVQRWKVDDRAG